MIRFARAFVLVAVLSGAYPVADAAARESGIQITPDLQHVLVNKDVDTSRFVITQDGDGGSVTGNVFFTDDRPPTFLFCTATGGSTFACSGADSCPSNGRQSGIQRRPDGKGVLVSKDVGGSRFAITENASDGSLIGNVFFTDGRGPQFLSCQPKGGNAYACFGSDRCGDASCPGYTFIADVTLPDGFFSVPSGCPDYAFIANVTLPDDFFRLPGTGSSDSAEIFGAITKVTSGAGGDATLERGAPPTAALGAASTIGGAQAQFGGFSDLTVVVPLPAGAATTGVLPTAARAAAANDDALIIAAARPDGSLMEGFYELPLASTTASSALLDLTFANTTTIPLVRLATRIGGVVGRYESTLVSFSFNADTPLFGFQVRAHYPTETGTFIGAADHVSCRIPALDVGIFQTDQDFCRSGDRVAFLANNQVDAGTLVLQVVSCNPNANDPNGFLPFPIQIVCGFAAAAGQTLAPLEDIGVTVDEVVVDQGGPEPGDPNDLGVKTGLVVQQ